MPNTWVCQAARDLPFDSERAWDADAAEARVFEWAWNGGVAPADGGNARKAFLLYDPEQATDRAAYLLPFADVVDGRLVACPGGLRACASEVPGVDLTDIQGEAIERTLTAYADRQHEEAATEEEHRAGGILLARAPLDTRGTKQPANKDELPEELLAHIHDKSVLNDDLPYLNAAWGSTDLVDTYFTRMLPSTLQNFADDASAGISMQNSHRSDELGLGRTWKGVYTAKRGTSPGRSIMDFYIPPNLRVTDVSTNDVIQGIRWGTIKDVSVGFYGGELRCSIDQKPMLRNLFFLLFFGGEDDDRETIDPDGPCNHLPGVEYWKRDKDGNKTDQREVAVGEIDGAHLAELSFVFDGATPQAQIKGRQAPVLAKAARMAELGVLSPATALALENRFRSRGVRFPELTTRHYALGHLADLTVRARRDTTPTASPALTGTEEADPPASAGDSHPPAEGDTPTTEPEEAAPMPEPTERAADAATTSTTTVQPAEPGGAVATTPANLSSPPATTDPLPGLRAALVKSGLAPEGFAGDLASRFTELGTEITGLREWADVGHSARDELVERCKKAGIRAFGQAGLPEAAYGPILTRGSYQELQDLLGHLSTIGDQRFPGGRKTEGSMEEPSTQERTLVAVPDRAFRA